MPVARAPAKVNLSLEITGLRADGYHLVNTWLAPLPDLYDTIEVRAHARPEPRDAQAASAGPVVRCPAVPELESPANLAARAARAYALAAALPPSDAGSGLEILIDKRIPLAAGLGGGSSDAAAVLRLLENQHRALGAAGLSAVAATLGADVPFFLCEGSARATGIGERLVPAPDPRWGWAVLAKPSAGLRTADVYRRFDERAQAQPAEAPPRRGEYFNDLEPAALELCPATGEALALLWAAGAQTAQVSGSGSACFGLFAAEAGARLAAAAVVAGGFWSAVSRVGGGGSA